MLGCDAIVYAVRKQRGYVTELGRESALPRGEHRCTHSNRDVCTPKETDAFSASFTCVHQTYAITLSLYMDTI